MQNSTHFILCFYQTLKRYILLLLNSSVSYNLSWWTRYEWECPGYCQQLFVPCVSLEHITHLYPWEVLLLKIVPGLSRHIFFTESKFNSNATCLRNTRNYFINFICINHTIHFFMRKTISFCTSSLIIVSVSDIFTLYLLLTSYVPNSHTSVPVVLPPLCYTMLLQPNKLVSSALSWLVTLSIQKYFDEVKAFPRGYLLGIAL